MTLNPVSSQKRTRRPDTRPIEIMEVARDLFSTNGFRATTLDQVAEAAGVTKGAIYHYFGGKDDLLLRSMKLWIDATVLGLEEELALEIYPPSARLRQVVRRACQDWLDPRHRDFLRLVEGELVNEFPELVHRFDRESVRPALTLFENILEEGKKIGEFRSDLDTKVAVRFLLLGIHRLFTGPFPPHLLSGDGYLHPDRVIHSVLDVFFRGLWGERADE